MNPYRRYTDTEIAAANDTDLPELLSHLGYSVRRVGSYYTTKEMDSLRIKDRRIWFRNSEATDGDKQIAFHAPCGPALDRVAVFEAPIDLMSWFTLYGPCNAIALCGLHDAPLGTYLDENPRIGRIVLCLDADGPGREAAGRLGEKYRGLGYGTEERFPPSGKDWNEYLIMTGENHRPRLPPGRR